MHRIHCPKSIDEGRIANILSTGKRAVILQFMDESNYNSALLHDINRVCKAFGAKVVVRFYGHYGGKFDCEWLQHIPEVRSLSLDCLTGC